MFKRNKTDPVEVKFNRELEKEMLVSENRNTEKLQGMIDKAPSTQFLKEQAAKPRTATDVIAATVANHQDSMKKNREYMNGCANKVAAHLQEVERLNAEIADIQRLNDALESMVQQLTVEPEREFLGEDHTAKQEAKTKVSREMLDNMQQDDERDDPPKGGE